MATGKPSKECGVCCEDYDEVVHCPRILKCYHTLCTDCIRRSIRSNSQRCPFCRRPFRVNAAHEVPVNQAALDLLKCFFSLESTLKTSRCGSCSANELYNHDPLTEMNEVCGELLTRCHESKKRIANILKHIDKLQEDIEPEKIVTQIVSMLHDTKVSHIERSVARLSKARNCLNIQMKEVEAKKEELQVTKTRLGNFLDQKYNKSSSLKEEAERVVTDARKWLRNLKNLLDEEGQIHTTIKEIGESKDDAAAVEALKWNGNYHNAEHYSDNVAALTLQGDLAKDSLSISGPEDDLDTIILNDLKEEEEQNIFEDPDIALKFKAALTSHEDADFQTDMNDMPILEQSRLKRLLDQSKLFAIQTFRGRRSDQEVIKDYSNLCLHQELADFQSGNSHLNEDQSSEGFVII
ncbi:uncharacterized protein [Palaemon carinicauda]|uniref:uncharacterized protein n=1 Tax=Palaemon carinicauda TaxID=392227 RepID=UPI0035B699DD